MANTIALHAKAPQVYVGDVADDVQRFRMNEMKIEDAKRQGALDDMKMRDAVGQQGALERFRKRRGMNDPAAMKELDPYPELSEKLGKAFDGMTPDQYRESTARAQAFGQAARRVASFAEGSPEQAEAWVVELDRLHKAGHIDRQSRDLWAEQGPNMDIINEAMTVEDFVKTHVPKNALERKRITDIDEDNMRAEAKDQSMAEDRAKRREIQATKKGSKKEPAAVEDDEGLTENEYGRRVRHIQTLIEKRREGSNATAAELAQYEKDLRAKYKIPDDVPTIDASGTGDGNTADKTALGVDAKAKPPAMKDRVVGKTYATPKGPMIWTGEGWRAAEDE